MNQCFIFRTHIYTDVHVSLVQEYIEQLDGYCDVIVLLNVKDKSDASVDIIRKWRRHNFNLCIFYEQDLHLRYSHYKGAWLHCQYGFYECYVQYPNYNFYWFCEYDTRFTGNIKTLLQAHEHQSQHLLGTHIQTYVESKDWYWWTESHVNLDIPLINRYKYFPAICRLSSQLLSKLHQDNIMYYSVIESFIPSVCVKYFGETSISNLNSIYWNNHTMRFQPSHGDQQQYINTILNNTKYANLLFHPIK